jgi:hypothetical protein
MGLLEDKVDAYGPSDRVAPSPGEDLVVSRVLGAALGLVTLTTTNVLSLTLTPGKWLVIGVVNYLVGATTVVTFLVAGIGTASAAMPSNELINTRENPFGPNGAIGISSMVAPSQVFTVAADTPVYLLARAGFSISTLAAFGYMRAVRLQ